MRAHAEAAAEGCGVKPLNPWDLLTPEQRRRAMLMRATAVGNRRADRVCVLVNCGTGEIGSVSRHEYLTGIITPTVREPVEAWMKRRSR